MIFFKSEPDVKKRLLPKKSAKKRRLLHSVAFKLIFCRKKNFFKHFMKPLIIPCVHCKMTPLYQPGSIKRCFSALWHRVCTMTMTMTPCISTWIKYKKEFFCTMTPCMHIVHCTITITMTMTNTIKMTPCINLDKV